MKKSEKAKAAGFKNLNDLAKAIGQSARTLHNWSDELFDAALLKAVLDKTAKKN